MWRSTRPSRSSAKIARNRGCSPSLCWSTASASTSADRDRERALGELPARVGDPDREGERARRRRRVNSTGFLDVLQPVVEKNHVFSVPTFPSVNDSGTIVQFEGGVGAAPAA